MPQQIVALYRADVDRPVLDRAVGIAEAGNSRIVLAVPLAQPSSFVYLAPVPFDLELLRSELEKASTRLAADAVARVPRRVPVTSQLVPRGGEADFLSAIGSLGPGLFVRSVWVDRFVDWKDRIMHKRWEQAARGARMPVLKIEPHGRGREER